MDCNTTTPPEPEVREEVVRYLDEEYGNAGSRTEFVGVLDGHQPLVRRDLGGQGAQQGGLADAGAAGDCCRVRSREGHARGRSGGRPAPSREAAIARVCGPAPEHIIETARLARGVVASRPAGVSQDDLVSPMPGELAGHVRALQASPAAGPMFTEGWQVQMVDLTGVCAFQPLVYSDRSFESTHLLC